MFIFIVIYIKNLVKGEHFNERGFKNATKGLQRGVFAL